MRDALSHVSPAMTVKWGAGQSRFAPLSVDNPA